MGVNRGIIPLLLAKRAERASITEGGVSSAFASPSLTKKSAPSVSNAPLGRVIRTFNILWIVIDITAICGIIIQGLSPEFVGYEGKIGFAWWDARPFLYLKSTI